MEALGINLPGLIAQIVNFLLLLVLLRAFAYKPIMGMLDTRSERIRESLAAAERARAEAAQSQSEIQAQIDQARREGQAIIEQASRAAEQLRQQLTAEAQAQAEAIVQRAREEFALERDKAIADLRRQFADLTVIAAEKVINQSLDRTGHERLIMEVLDQSRLS